MAFNITSLSWAPGILRSRLSYTSSATSIPLKMRCFSMAEIKSTGTSVKGANFCLSFFSYSFAVLVSFSILSHLFTSTTMPLPFLTANEKIERSCAVIPFSASKSNKHTSASSMALIARITE